MLFLPLYKKSNTGAIQYWCIGVSDNVITTTFGQVDGALQTTEDVITQGKSLGKKNATTPNRQAFTEASAKWTKQKKKGYVESIEAALAGETDAVIEGGIEPMLSLNKSHPADPILKKYLKFPCCIQTKLDGVRCIAIRKSGKVTLWSRRRRAIKSMPHIITELETIPAEFGDFILDGELYNHAYKDRFQDLISIIRKDEPDYDLSEGGTGEGLYREVQLHVYDMPSVGERPYAERYDLYTYLVRSIPNQTFVTPVLAYPCHGMTDLLGHYERFLSDGYEGAMAKNIEAPYEGGKRSHEILKMKEFFDGEATIIGVNPGRGKESDCAATFTVQGKPTADGTFVPLDDPRGMGEVVEFYPRMACPLGQKQKYLKEADSLVGKVMTFTAKRLTKDGVPYIPVGKGVRDYE